MRTRLALVLSVALLLRLWGLGHGYPDCVSGDERPVIMDAVRFVTEGTLEPAHLNYPDLFSYLFSLGLYVAYAVGWLLDAGDAAASVRFAYLFAPVQVALVGRLLSALAGTATVWLTWHLGRRAYGERSGIALGGALFAAASVSLVSQARLALPDVTMGLLAAAAYLPLLAIARHGRTRDYLLAGALIGLAASTKYNAGVVLAGLVAAHVLWARRHGGGLVHARLLWAGLAALAGFVAGSPYWALAPGKYLQALLNVSSNMEFSLTAEAWPHLRLLGDFLAAEPGWALPVLAGCAQAAWQRRDADWIALAIIVPAFLYIGSWPKGGMHYALFTFPLAGLLAARTLVEAWAVRRRGGALLVLTALTLPAVWLQVERGQQLRQPDVRTEAARWIETHIPDGTVVGIYRIDYTPPLKGDIHRRMVRALAAASAGDPRRVAQLEAMDRRMRTYTQLTLEYFADAPLVPAAYRHSVDLGDPKTREIFRRRWMDYEELKAYRVRYVILPSAGYGRFFGGEVPPAGTAARYYYLRSREYVSQFRNATTSRYRLVQSFGAGGGERIEIYEVL